MKYELKGNYFNNQYVQPPTTGPDAVETFIKRYSPADTSLLLWNCAIDYSHVDQAVDSAVQGFKAWRKTSIEERKNYLKRYQEEIISKQDAIAESIAYETGKPLWEAKTEAAALIAKVDVTINEGLKRIEEKHIDEILPNTKGHVFYRPIGPCLVIGPFNFPCHLANGQIVNALLAGNSIIFKPSEKACHGAQMMIDAFDKAGFPKGVINLVQGNGEIAGRLVRSKAIKGIFFTGSKEVGLKILKSTYRDLSKLVSLELGGKNCSIIHKDANIEACYGELIKACFLTSGQRCISTSIVPIHRSLIDEFVAKFHQYAKKIIIDHPVEYDREPFMGPLIDQRAVDNYINFIGMAKREGIEEIMRGKVLERKFKGHYVSPSIHIASKMDKGSHFLMSEVFGPNCTFIPYDEIEEAIEITNSTEYGLAASVFTQETSVFEQCVRDIDCGQVNWNRSTVGASSRLPFGGVKNSGNYRPAAITTIDACVYQMASLEIVNPEAEDIKTIKGLDF